MASTRTISSTTCTPSRSTGSAATTGWRAGLARLPGRKLVFTNGDAPYARRVLEAIGVGEHFDELHDIHAASCGPSPTRMAMRLLCERFGIDPDARGDGRRHGAEPEAGERAGHDDGVGRQWLRTRQSRPPTPTSSTSRIADVGEWLEDMLGENEDERPTSSDHRGRLGQARRDRPATDGDVREAVEARSRRSTAARRASPRRSTASGASTSGSRRRCCCRSASIRWTRSPAGPGGAPWWDKVPSKFLGWGDGQLRQGRLPRRAGRDRPPRRLCRARARC